MLDLHLLSAAADLSERYNSVSYYGLRVSDNDVLVYSSGDVSIPLYCAMDFWMYPMDTHR